MRLSIGAYDLLIILSLIATSTASPHYAKPGCSDRCGNVTIPFPFGIGAKCSVNEWYVINCNSSIPYLSAFNHLEVLGVSLVNQTVTVNTPTTSISDCQYPVLNSSRQSVDLDRSPFRLVLEGCGNAVISHNENALSGCSSICLNDSTVREKNNCFGFTCCETRIPYHPEITSGPYNRIDAKLMPYYLTSYKVELTGCGSAFFMDENLYVEGRFPNQGSVPVSLLWTLSDLDFQQITCCGLVYFKRKCSQSPELEGNAYLSDGCAVKKECASCMANGGDCRYDDGWNFTCDTDGDGDVTGRRILKETFI